NASMPQAARQIAGADYILPASAIGALLAELAQQPMAEKGAATMSDPLEQLPECVLRDFDAQIQGARRGEISTFSCPECGGPLWQVDEIQLLRFRCHVGHAYYA